MLTSNRAIDRVSRGGALCHTRRDGRLATHASAHPRAAEGLTDLDRALHGSRGPLPKEYVMRSISALRRPLAIAACAGAIAWASSELAAQDEDSSARGGKSPDQAPAPTRPTQPENSSARGGVTLAQTSKSQVEKAAAKPEQQALRAAHEEAIAQARGLQQLASQEKEQLDHQEISTRVERIGVALENARQHLASLEAVVPESEKTRERFDDIREKQDSAGEHQRALVQQVEQPGLDMSQIATIEGQAKQVVKDVQKAESERQKLPGGSVPQRNDSTSRTPS
jgi:hypothetical protein